MKLITEEKGLDDNDAGQNIMDNNLIIEYFSEMDKQYNLKSSEEIEQYICGVKKKMSK